VRKHWPVHWSHCARQPQARRGDGVFQDWRGGSWLQKNMSGSGGVEVVYGHGCCYGTDCPGSCTEIKLGASWNTRVVVDSTTAFVKNWVGTVTDGQVLSIEEGTDGSAQIFSIKICRRPGGPCGPCCGMASTATACGVRITWVAPVAITGNKPVLSYMPSTPLAVALPTERWPLCRAPTQPLTS